MAFTRITATIISIFFLLTQTSSAQQMTNYSTLWKKIDSLEGKGLTQSALNEVNKIYLQAKKEKQDAQVIKALLYQTTLQQSVIADADKAGILQWQQEINTASQPAKSLMQSLLAQAYYQYFQQQRYQLYNRTATTNFIKTDIATWSAEDFHSKIAALFLASLNEEKLLQQTRIETFEPVIIKGNTRNLRPTLYDLLTNRALEYFKSTENDITNTAYSFEINDKQYFAPAEAFSKLVINARDSASLYYRALTIYQQLLSFHLHDAVPDALIDADIQRLQFVQQHAVMENKNTAYEQSLTTISAAHSTVPAAAQAMYLIAQLHADKAALYDPLKNNTADSNNLQGDYLVAANLCRQVIQQKEQSEGKANCYNLLQQIEKKECKLTTEKVNLPEQPFRTLVSYRNFSKLYCRIIRFNDELKKKLANRYDDSYWKSLTTLTPLHNWEQELPVTNDYQRHTAEIKVDALPLGQYLLLTSTDAGFSLNKNPLAVQYFYVSGISYINNLNDYFILNRESGKPLPGAAVQVWWTQYDSQLRGYSKIKGEKQEADKNGFVHFANPNRQGNFQIEINHQNDRLFLDENQYFYGSFTDKDDNAATEASYEKDNARVFFFTDRSIYRPGQTMYFKGIAVTKDFASKKNKIYQDVSSTIFLRNANGEDVDSIKLKTNEYGSYAGKFILPKGTLNGAFTLIDENADGTTTFSVEEYKRPTFLIEYEKIKGTYRVNDSIHITGMAKAYAGNNIDGAQVKYRVQRVPRFIYPWLYRRWGGYPDVNKMEITNGVITTNAEGKFSITFKAIPDLSVQKELEPVFDYKITADITDLNGETRSAETTVPVSYKSLQLKVLIPEVLPADSLQHISVRTENLNGEFEPAQVNVYLYGLQSPGRLVRARYWQQPDQFAMTKEEFIKNFPYDEYQHEADYRSWARDKIYLRKIDSTNSNGTFSLPASKLPEGWYAIEVSTKDKFGEEVKDVQYVQLVDEKSKETPTTSYTWSEQKKMMIEPGEQSTITIGSAAADVYLIQEIAKIPLEPGNSKPGTSDNIAYHYINLKGKQSFSFAATEADRGGFGVSHFFVKNNRFYSLSNNISVPWINKELDITYETFRDKTLPGSEEKWKLKISGYKKEMVAGEMLASMYDASLDQFKPHNWTVPAIWPTYFAGNGFTGYLSFNQVQSQEKYWNEEWRNTDKRYDAIMMESGLLIARTYRLIRDRATLPAPMASAVMPSEANKSVVNSGAKLSEISISGSSPLSAGKAGLFMVDGVPVSSIDGINPADIVSTTILKGAEATALYGAGAANGVVVIITRAGEKNQNNTPVQIRKNFNETAFFFPDLKTDSSGSISFGFTVPEALTRWKFQGLVHNKDLAFGYSTNTVVTQKPLMVQPNAPRFLREGDKIELSAKVVNLGNKELTGTVELNLNNAANNEPVDGWFANMYPTQYFTAAAGQSTVVKFTINVPYQYNSAVTYRFVAKSDSSTDGEEAALPVLSNSMLVTESMPLPMRGNGAKNFRFEKLLQSGNSETLQQHALTVEFTTNPAWYAVQALPYLMEYPYECAEQTFNRYYANAIAAKTANASPRLKDIFQRWKTTDTAALLSNLQKNPELKAVLLEETPWVLEAKNETQQKKNIALLFDMVKMSTALSSSFDKLKKMQGSNGGFVWFTGGPDDRYMTQYIVTGIGHLKKLGALTAVQQKEWNIITGKAVKYLDQRIKEEYDYLVKHESLLTTNHLSYTAIQYLYMRSFFSEYNLPGESFAAVNYYRKQSQQFWLQQNKYMQGMIALSLFRSGDIKTAGDILKSLKQNAVTTGETGMYWKDNANGYYWYQAPVETQSLLIEAFAEISKDTKVVNDLKTWLLKQKQTQNWKTTKATAEACYALLLQGSDWLSSTPEVEIKLGDKTISSGSSTEAGTGYFKQTIDGRFIKPAMGDISVKIATAPIPAAVQPAWGAVYWQYFEQLDNITSAATPLQLNKKLFIEKTTDKGPVLEPVNENGEVKVGNKIKVRIELRVDRDMEYVHMKDMRASCMEPVNVLSNYKWQDGLGYYESTKDASTNFFFNWLPKGTYVFEYPLFVTHTGTFSNGVTSIQCMYAPEFSSHSESTKVNAEENK